MAIVWRKEMSIDDGIIDADHNCLIDIVNDVDRIRPGPAMRNGLAVILMRLGAYAGVHFRREERLQLAAQYPDTDAHHHTHNALLHALDAMRVESEKPRSPQDMKQFHDRLCHFLHDWLVNHIIKVDLTMKPYLAEIPRQARDLVSLNQAVYVANREHQQRGSC